MVYWKRKYDEDECGARCCCYKTKPTCKDCVLMTGSSLEPDYSRSILTNNPLQRSQSLDDPGIYVIKFSTVLRNDTVSGYTCEWEEQYFNISPDCMKKEKWQFGYRLNDYISTNGAGYPYEPGDFPVDEQFNLKYGQAVGPATTHDVHIKFIARQFVDLDGDPEPSGIGYEVLLENEATPDPTIVSYNIDWQDRLYPHDFGLDDASWICCYRVAYTVVDHPLFGIDYCEGHLSVRESLPLDMVYTSYSVSKVVWEQPQSRIAFKGIEFEYDSLESALNNPVIESFSTQPGVVDLSFGDVSYYNNLFDWTLTSIGWASTGTQNDLVAGGTVNQERDLSGTPLHVYTEFVYTLTAKLNGVAAKPTYLVYRVIFDPPPDPVAVISYNGTDYSSYTTQADANSNPIIKEIIGIPAQLDLSYCDNSQNHTYYATTIRKDGATLFSINNASPLDCQSVSIDSPVGAQYDTPYPYSFKHYACNDNICTFTYITVNVIFRAPITHTYRYIDAVFGLIKQPEAQAIAKVAKATNDQIGNGIVLSGSPCSYHIPVYLVPNVDVYEVKFKFSRLVAATANCTISYPSASRSFSITGNGATSIEHVESFQLTRGTVGELPTVVTQSEGLYYVAFDVVLDTALRLKAIYTYLPVTSNWPSNESSNETLKNIHTPKRMSRWYWNRNPETNASTPLDPATAMTFDGTSIVSSSNAGVVRLITNLNGPGSTSSYGTLEGKDVCGVPNVLAFGHCRISVSEFSPMNLVYGAHQPYNTADYIYRFGGNSTNVSGFMSLESRHYSGGQFSTNNNSNHIGFCWSSDQYTDISGIKYIAILGLSNQLS